MREERDILQCLGIVIAWNVRAGARGGLFSLAATHSQFSTIHEGENDYRVVLTFVVSSGVGAVPIQLPLCSDNHREMIEAIESCQKPQEPERSSIHNAVTPAHNEDTQRKSSDNKTIEHQRAITQAELATRTRRGPLL